MLKKGGENKRECEFHKDLIKNIYDEVSEHLKSDWSHIKGNIETKGSIF